MSYNNWHIIHCINIIKQHEATNTDINVRISHNSIRNISLNIVKNLSDNGYGAIYTIVKKLKSGYYLVKWTIYSYTLKFSHKIVNILIKAGELVCDVLYLNPPSNFNQWYTPYEKKTKDKQLSG